MNVHIPEDLAEAITALATRNRISPEEAVRQAIVWFVKEDEQFWSDFRAGERASDEALALIDKLAEGDAK
jgi:hypothetical protein